MQALDALLNRVSVPRLVDRPPPRSSAKRCSVRPCVRRITAICSRIVSSPSKVRRASKWASCWPKRRRCRKVKSLKR